MRVPTLVKRAFVIVLPLAFAMLAAGGAVSRAQEDESLMRVFLNHAKILKLDRPVSKVIIGNALVADATVADSRTIVLTGKAFGTTNLVLLDVDGNALLDEQVLVTIDEKRTLRLFRQTERTVYSCTPSCEEHQALEGGNK
jgi:Flp pilus assembly secretin CpaC